MTGDDHRLTLRRRFDAPPDLVFKAWTDPASPVGWWGPAGFALAFYDSDARPGGRWRLGMRSAEGVPMVSAGTYRELGAPTRLVMTHGWEAADGRLGVETLVTIGLSEREGGTEMLFEQAGFQSAASRAGHEGGWAEAFDALAGALRVARR